MARVTKSVAGAVRRLRTLGADARQSVALARAAVRTRRHRGDLVPGLLSVVVPAHDVERYIGAALDSLRRQRYADLEIVVVDDGSTDGTARVAARRRRRDPRIRIVPRPNGGPSAARNTGVDAARGEFLTFLDPDDLLSPGIYRTAIDTLRASGSDFAVFSYDRMEHGRRKRPGPWITQAHAARRLRCTLADAPDIQVNAVVWSKVFRRSFYDAAGLRFVEGTIYEDQPLCARAYARAAAFDILPDVGVTWRIRDEMTSITQQTPETPNLAAHNAAVRLSLAELEAAGHSAAATARALQLLANNMRLFIRHAGTGDDAYWAALRIGLRELIDRVSEVDYVREVPAQEKVLHALILRDDRARAAAFLEADGLTITHFPSERGPDGRYRARLPFFDDPAAAVPADRFVLADRQLSMNARITDVRRDGANGVVLDGWAYIRNVDLANDPPRITVRAIAADGTRTELRTEQRFCEDPSRVAMHEHCDYRNGCFSAWIDGSVVDPAWRFEVELSVPGLSRSAPLALPPIDRPR